MRSISEDDIPRTITWGHMRLVISSLLSDCSIPSPALEADRLMSSVLGVARSELHAHPERVVGEPAFARMIELSVRRASGEPTAHLLTSAIFCGRMFHVDHRVLIPRTETEVMTLAARREIEAIGRSGTLADWCTGSGCIAAALLADSPGWRGYGVDASADALAVAKINAQRHGVVRRLTLIECADPFDASSKIPRRSLDMIIANPPYIPTKDIASLEPQVRCFEPRIALDGGVDGLAVARMIVELCPMYMKPGAILMMETGGAEQVRSLSRFAVDKPLDALDPMADHRGIERFALFRAR